MIGTHAPCAGCALRQIKAARPPVLPAARDYIVTTRATRYGTAYALVHIDAVAWVKSEQKTTLITPRGADKTLFVECSVKTLIATFSELLMVSRGFAVHRQLIAALTYGERGDPCVRLHGHDTSHHVGRTYLPRVRRLFRDRAGALPSRAASALQSTARQ